MVKMGAVCGGRGCDATKKLTTVCGEEQIFELESCSCVDDGCQNECGPESFHTPTCECKTCTDIFGDSNKKIVSIVKEDPSEADPFEKELLLSDCMHHPTSSHGNSPLKHAVNYSNLAWVNLFLEHGEDPNIPNAYRARYTPIMGIYFNKGDPNTCPEIGQALLDAGADINATDNNGDSALWIARKRFPKTTQQECLDWLEEKGA